ncbi:alpha/beta hydrolase [Micromonospora echinofusca]|uniref:Lipase n=1 Tax=Micromonospora echinofusca TaxID=47858 RepID=A0ABS3VSI8_MICEH|nr:alpha/beta hydrolase [Micromonospora echinofusca]MBO4207490.1 lipase [Micromonospora echinofusca]
MVPRASKFPEPARTAGHPSEDSHTSLGQLRRRTGRGRRFWRGVLGLGLGVVAVLTLSGAGTAGGALAHGDAGRTGFYQSPSRWELENTPVGGVFATEPMPVTEPVREASSQALRIKYRSEGIHGTPIAVTGSLMLPRGVAPKQGWPVIAWGHGTTGIGPECAPSRDPELGSYDSLIAHFLRAGYAVVATDYAGLGLSGKLHNFLQKYTLARSMIDSVLAARNVSPEVGRRWFAAGHSEGGLPTLGVGEIGQQRAPELELLGIVPMSIASGASTAGNDALAAARPPFTAATLASAVFLAYTAVAAVEFAPESIRYTDLLSPELAAQLPALERLCLDEAIEYLANLDPPLQRLANPDWTRNQTLLRWMRSIAPVQQHIDVPILLASGGRDTIAAPSGVNLLLAELCSFGDVVEHREYPEATHVTIIYVAPADIVTWLNARLRGVPARQECQPLVDVDDLTPRDSGMHGK